MQFKNLAFSLLVAVAAADSVDQLVTQIPSCALTCLISGSSKVGCAVTDYACQCNNASALQDDVTPCVSSSCSASDAATALTVSGEICVAVGVTSVTSGIASATSAAGSAASSISSSLASGASSVTATSTSATSTASTAAAGRMEIGAMAGAAAVFAFAL
ncbi:hypothetical protein AB5N19_09526 [Seiridium cardinale]